MPSFLVNPEDIIAVREKSKKNEYFKELTQNIDGSRVPEWLDLDTKALLGRVVSMPSREHIDATLEEQLIVEFYSR